MEYRNENPAPNREECCYATYRKKEKTTYEYRYDGSEMEVIETMLKAHGRQNFHSPWLWSSPGTEMWYGG
jgi:hypothetical protein